MASSSTYDLFLSFGEDTRKNFADHLYTALEKQGINTYRDDESHFQPGSILSPPFKAIEDSKVAVVILSKNYAESSWCLDELSYVIESTKVRGQMVFTVFYDVDRSDVRYQRGDFGRVFEKHELHHNNYKAKSWREALRKAADLSGWDVKGCRSETECIRLVVERVALELRDIFSSSNEDLTLTETGIQDLKSFYSQPVAAPFPHSMDDCVYLSFRGEDTRQTFVHHLYTALEQQNIYVVKDDDAILNRGEGIYESLYECIRKSRVAVIVFSKNYARSHLCLDELVYIMNCREERGLVVIPIFYDVEPSEVRKQMGDFGRVFNEHELNDNRVESWIKALSGASEIAGWEVRNVANGYESRCIKQIVDTISGMLPPVLSSSSKDLLGKKSRLQDLKSKLEIGSGGVFMVGIWGVGGSGKSILASSIYNDISWNFDGCCFLENIWDKSRKDGLRSLQEKMLSDVLKEKQVEVGSVVEGKFMIKSKLHYRKVLIVLDGVDHIDQLEALVGSHDWFGVGSTIIITTKDEHLLRVHKVDVIHTINLLNDEAIGLFDKQAFPVYHRRKESYELLSKDVVSYAGGPLSTIKGLELGTRGRSRVTNPLDTLLSQKLPFKIKNGLDPLLDILVSMKKLRFLTFASLDVAKEVLYPPENIFYLRPRLQKQLLQGYKYLLHLGCINLSYVHTIVTTPDFDGLPCLKVSRLRSCSNFEEIHPSLGHHASLVHLSVFRCHKLKMLPIVTGMVKLETLNLSGLDGIVTTPDFGGLSSLKVLRLHYCSSLEEIHPSLGHHASLVYLSIIWCHKLRMLPTITGMKNLETLEILHCEGLHEFLESHAIINRYKSILTKETIETFSRGVSSLWSSHPIPASYSQWWNHDVFLSFIGDNDSMKFVDHLHSTLIHQGIHTYKSKKTKAISHDDLLGSFILNAIEESQIAIIIFTKDYAGSSRCLYELEHIMKCINMRGLHIMPIFYDVSSTEVQEQNGEFGEEFDRLELQNMAKIDTWRKALKGACNHSGWSLKHIANRHEGRHVKDIVATISHRLSSLILNVKKGLIGIGPRSKRLTSELAIESSGVRIVGIWGIGGLGKTTIASCVYMEISRQFEGGCFLENISEKSSKCGMKKLQQKILSTILKQEVNVPSDKEGRLMLQSMLSNRKVLIVLDDVSDLYQVESLAGAADWFGSGSRIIITTREKSVLSHKVDVLYSVSILSDDEAIKLFHSHAYPEYDRIEAYDTLSLDVISYANGIPLTLKILGSFLYEKDKDEWIIALAKLRDIETSRIIDKLKISYDGLQPDEKEMFLDIACFFRGEFVDSSLMLLDAFGFNPLVTLNVLVKKSLVTVLNGMFDMHNLVKEMAYHIAKEEHPEHPQKHTRVWQSSDVAHICAMDTTKEMNDIQALYAPDYDAPPNILKIVANMKSLRLLNVHQHVKEEVEEPLFLSDALRWISWDNYPANSFPTSFQPTMLFGLILRNGLQKVLWQEFQYLPRLKLLDLHGFNLVMTPDFDGLGNLENWYYLVVAV